MSLCFVNADLGFIESGSRRRDDSRVGAHEGLVNPLGLVLQILAFGQTFVDRDSQRVYSTEFVRNALYVDLALLDVFDKVRITEVNSSPFSSQG